MSDNKRLIYGLAGAAAIALIGVGIWYASAEDEYEHAKEEIAKMGTMKVANVGEGQILELS